MRKKYSYEITEGNIYYFALDVESGRISHPFAGLEIVGDDIIIKSYVLDDKNFWPSVNRLNKEIRLLREACTYFQYCKDSSYSYYEQSELKQFIETEKIYCEIKYPQGPFIWVEDVRKQTTPDQFAFINDYMTIYGKQD